MVNKWLKDGRARYAQARSGFLSYSTQCTWEEIEYEEKILQMGEVCPFFLFGDWMYGIESTDFIARMAKLCPGQEPYRVLQPADLKLGRVHPPMLAPGDWSGVKKTAFNWARAAECCPAFLSFLMKEMKERT